MSPTNEERPVLVGLYEEISQSEETKEAYSLVLRFRSPLMDFATWQQKQEKLTRFFGPGIVAVVAELENKEVDLKLISVK